MPVVPGADTGMTLADLRSRVRKLTGIDSTSVLADADIDERLNEAYREITGLKPWRPLLIERSATAAASVVLTGVAPTEPTEPVSVIATSTDDVVVDVRWVAPDRFGELDPTVTGRPSLYTTDTSGADLELKVWPSPEAGWTLTITGHSGIEDMSAGTDEPWLPPEFRPMLAYATAARLLVEEGDDTPRVASYNNEVRAYLQQMMGRYLTGNDRGLIKIGRHAGKARSFGRVR